jgi:hypothetical protein
LRCQPREHSEVWIIFWKALAKPKGSCGKADCGCNSKTRLFGPGTLVALLFAVAIVVIGVLNSPSDAKLASKLPAPLHPLIKPEPGSLLSEPGLNLSKQQRSAIQAIDKRWQAEREPLLAGMNGYQPASTHLEAIKGGLQDYSALSRRYDATREQRWQEALDALKPDQRSRVGGGSK